MAKFVYTCLSVSPPCGQTPSFSECTKASNGDMKGEEPAQAMLIAVKQSL